MIETPVVFIVFNRPTPTRRVLERIRQERPSKLFVVCDGPRSHVPTDAERVAEVRAIIEQGVDWPCELLKNYADVNMGCRARVVSGLNWAFSLAEQAIILEDDCLPGPSFFTYCEALLDHYRDTPEVMHIGANNFQGWRLRTTRSHFFSKYNHVWGWATWRRAWELFDADADCWKNPEQRARIERLFDSPAERDFWTRHFDALHDPVTRRNVWDYYWTLTCWSHGGLATYPAVNLVENIGFGEDATHTAGASAFHIPARCLAKISFPQKIVRNVAADRYTCLNNYLMQATFPLSAWHQARITAGSVKKSVLGWIRPKSA